MLQLTQHMFCGADFEIARCFDIDLFDDAVIDDKAETLAAFAHAECSAVHFKAECGCKITIAVGEHHNVV